MNAQLDVTDILHDLDAFYLDRDLGAGLDLETSAQVYALIVEVAAHVRMLRTTKPKGNTGTACTYLEQAAAAMLALLSEHGAVAERAEAILDAMPAGGRRQALEAVCGD